MKKLIRIFMLKRKIKSLYKDFRNSNVGSGYEIILDIQKTQNELLKLKKS